jgi:general secretion pathway protein B
LRLDRAAAQAPDPGRPAVAAPVPERIPRLAELPDSLRRELPALAIGGSVHSPDPNARMVILNGQVQREGDTVGNGLVLKRIRATSAVFEYRGQIFEMPF